MEGGGYSEVLPVAGEEPSEALIARGKQTGDLRSAFYFYHGVAVRESAQPTFTPELAATIARERVRNAQRLTATCESYFIELPATGVSSCA